MVADVIRARTTQRSLNHRAKIYLRLTALRIVANTAPNMKALKTANLFIGFGAGGGTAYKDK